MLPLRTIARESRTRGPASLRRQPIPRGQRRLATRAKSEVEADSAPSPARAKDVDPSVQRGTSNLSQSLLGGLAGGGSVLLLGYTWYHFSGAKSAVNSISQTTQYATQVTEKVKQKAPEPKQALQWLRETAQAYASLIPGARGHVDKALDDLDRIHEKHGSEVDQLISETYDELRRVAKDKGASVEGMYEAWSVLERRMREIGSLASDAAEDVMDNHPELREKLGGSFQTLQSMGENYGPEAKEQVKKTLDEVRQIFSQGTTAEAVQKAQQVLEERTRTIKGQAQKAWQSGMQRAQPYLEKSPKAKQLIEENEDALKQGNLGHLWAQVRNAADTGTTQQLGEFIQHTKEQIQGRSNGGSSSQGGASGSNPLQSLAGGSEVLTKMQSLAELAQKNGQEAEQLLKSTVDEVMEVLKRKTQEAESIAAKSGK